MSFPKAKIRRFNDTADSTPLPGPGQYNPTIKTKKIGAYIPAGDRFKDPPPSPSVSETGSSGSVKSAPSTPAFAIPKKPATRLNQPTKHTPQTKNFNDYQEALNEKIVECKNKDMYIKELNEQIEDMKLQMGELKRRNSQLDEEKKAYEEKSERLKKDHEKAVDSMNRKHRDELSELTDKISLINQELRQTKNEMIELKKAKKEECGVLLENTSKFQKLYKITCTEYEKEIAEKNEQIKIKDAELERLSVLHKNEREELELELLKNYSESQKIMEKEKRDCAKKIKELEAKIKQLEEENEAKVKQIKEDLEEANLLNEMQMKEKQIEIEQEWKMKLDAQEKEAEAILKECQAISEYNIIQGELEKNDIKNKLNEKEVECQELLKEKDALKAHTENLQYELSKIIIELNETREKLGQETTKYKETLQKTHTYELTVQKTHETIEVLKTRLINSDRDVEQLKAELESCERSKLEYESKCNELREEIRMLHEQNDELEMQNESTLKQTQEDVMKVKKELLKKVDESFQYASELKNKLLVAEENRKEALQQLQEQQRLTHDAHILVTNTKLEMERLEGINTENEYVKRRLESTINNLQETLDKVLKNEKVLEGALEDAVNKKKETEKEKLELENSLHDSYLQIENYKKQIKEYEKNYKDANVLLKDYEEEKKKCEHLESYCAQLEKKVKDFEELIGPFREQLLQYELERKALVEETKELGLKYAEILGHQNLKQKIRHMVDLKQKNYELAERKKELEAKVKSQAKTIERLKKEIAQMTVSPRKMYMQCDGDNKENHSPAKNVLFTSSPGPLREKLFNNTPIKAEENV